MQSSKRANVKTLKVLWVHGRQQLEVMLIRTSVSTNLFESRTAIFNMTSSWVNRGCNEAQKVVLLVFFLSRLLTRLEKGGLRVYYFLMPPSWVQFTVQRSNLSSSLYLKCDLHPGRAPACVLHRPEEWGSQARNRAWCWATTVLSSLHTTTTSSSSTLTEPLFLSSLSLLVSVCLGENTDPLSFSLPAILLNI